MKNKYIVSACLLGKNCKYSGGNNLCPEIIKFLEDKEYYEICPEVDGGLPTPRFPSEIINGDAKEVILGNNKVINSNGDNVTKEFITGAEKAVSFAKVNNITHAILKSNSPSCGVKEVYDGSFSKKRVQGLGVSALMLKEEGIELIDSDDLISKLRGD